MAGRFNELVLLIIFFTNNNTSYNPFLRPSYLAAMFAAIYYFRQQYQLCKII